ncbi:hypothetical protein MML48_3g00013806 [Holotrichia oblita]|uniref:Uncharacterized protein n=1 Tax=Holotrichia oblita TaxID=644536 RepID=A0ACB9TBV4_HOLOL|nr:hypothetical protein MML48_3g00013806 [Holotrichia oblita]
MFNPVQTLHEMLGNKSLRTKLTPCLVLLILEVLFDVADSVSQAEINNHLELGKQFLAKGQLADALSHYHSAVEGDPNNYLTYFKRGTVYLALGKARNALSDLDRVLELKPDFAAARLSRGNVHLKLANYDVAQVDFYNVNWTYDRKKRLADYYYGNDDYLNAIQLLSEVIEVSPWASELYELRSEMHMENNDVLSAVSDIKAATKLQADNVDGYYKLSSLLYQQGQATEALKYIRECLKLDPEHKDCFPLYKKIKKVEKFLTEAENYIEEKNFAECIESGNKALKQERDVPMIIYNAKRILCTCYSNDEQTSEAVRICSDALDINQDPGVYCDRAEAYIQSELYDDAIRDFKAALDIDPNFERAKEGQQKAQKLQQQSERRDYYKILEVKKTASRGI